LGRDALDTTPKSGSLGEGDQFVCRAVSLLKKTVLVCYHHQIYSGQSQNIFQKLSNLEENLSPNLVGQGCFLIAFQVR